MQEVEFMGLQGYVKFDASGGVTPNVAIEQQQGNKEMWYIIIITKLKVFDNAWNCVQDNHNTRG